MKTNIIGMFYEKSTGICNSDGSDEMFISCDEFDSLANEIINISKSETIHFATWYSGMDKSQVENAYERFLEEVDKTF